LIIISIDTNRRTMISAIFQKSWSQLAAEGHAGSPGRTRDTGCLTEVPSVEAAENTGNARLGKQEVTQAQSV
jgi:hypothetical protein